MIDKRKSGVLLHITSLYSNDLIGTLGKSAYEFIDWLKLCGFSIWQILPLSITGYGNSPYQSISSIALNYYLIDFDILKEKKLLEEKDYSYFKKMKNKSCDYEKLFLNKIPILKKAFNNFKKNNKFITFEQNGVYKDFAVFMTLKVLNNYKPFYEWEKNKIYNKHLVESIIKKYPDEYLFWVWTQFEFLNQWNKLHSYAKKNNIIIIGDIPLYVAHDSVEVWKNKELFMFSDSKLKYVAGCPPDDFSKEGQLWGNPVYDWEYHKKNNYKWWDNRINYMFLLYDYIRIDHFRGFDRFYAIDYDSKTAKNGIWLDGPKFDFFKDKTKLNIIAEDLGFIDYGVKKLMDSTKYPGMKILQFAFDGICNNEHKPSNISKNNVIYTGTHDNQTLKSYIKNLDENKFIIFKKDLNDECIKFNVKPNFNSIKNIIDTIILLSLASSAYFVIFPLQDLLYLDDNFRMNIPSTISNNNWKFRITKKDLSISLAKNLNKLNKMYNRI